MGHAALLQVAHASVVPEVGADGRCPHRLLRHQAVALERMLAWGLEGHGAQLPWAQTRGCTWRCHQKAQLGVVEQPLPQAALRSDVHGS